MAKHRNFVLTFESKILDQAFKNFFRRVKRGDAKPGFPRFKKKGVFDSFRFTGTIKFVGRRIQLPRMCRIRLKERRERYFNGRILSATVSRRADRWFVSVIVIEELLVTKNKGSAIGIDLGISYLAMTSSGERFTNPHALGQRLRKLRRLTKDCSRKKTGSQNFKRAKMRLARLYIRISNIRKDTLHKLTTYLVKNHSQIVIEDLQVSEMLKNKSFARAIVDVGFYEFRRQLMYKTPWYGSELTIAPRFLPQNVVPGVNKLNVCCHYQREPMSVINAD